MLVGVLFHADDFLTKYKMGALCMMTKYKMGTTESQKLHKAEHTTTILSITLIFVSLSHIIFMASFDSRILLSHNPNNPFHVNSNPR